MLKQLTHVILFLSTFQVEVSSPNAESENTLCTNSILGQNTTSASASETKADPELPSVSVTIKCTNDSGEKLTLISYPRPKRLLPHPLVITAAQSSYRVLFLAFRKIYCNKFPEIKIRQLAKQNSTAGLRSHTTRQLSVISQLDKSRKKPWCSTEWWCSGVEQTTHSHESRIEHSCWLIIWASEKSKLRINKVIALDVCSRKTFALQTFPIDKLKAFLIEKIFFSSSQLNLNNKWTARHRRRKRVKEAKRRERKITRLRIVKARSARTWRVSARTIQVCFNRSQQSEFKSSQISCCTFRDTLWLGAGSAVAEQPQVARVTR